MAWKKRGMLIEILTASCTFISKRGREEREERGREERGREGERERGERERGERERRGGGGRCHS
jgi:hypothetical protein